MKNIKAVLKSPNLITKFLIDNCGDINDVDNMFYIKISGKQITLNGYCSDTDSFTCVEYPDYDIPAVFISNVVVNNKNHSSEYSNKEIGIIVGCTAENVRKICNKAIIKIQHLITNKQIEMA